MQSIIGLPARFECPHSTLPVPITLRKHRIRYAQRLLSSSNVGIHPLLQMRHDVRMLLGHVLQLERIFHQVIEFDLGLEVKVRLERDYQFPFGVRQPCFRIQVHSVM